MSVFRLGDCELETNQEAMGLQAILLEPAPQPGRSHYVTINGKAFPIKQLIPVDMAEISIWQGSILIEKSIKELGDKYFLNMYIAAIKRDNEFLPIVDKEIVRCGDILIVIGQRTSIQQLAELARDLVQVTDMRLLCEGEEKKISGYQQYRMSTIGPRVGGRQ